MEITEDWIRGLTGWKPFKEGKSIAERGLVTGFKRNGEVLQGTIREGRMNLRPVVKVVGPTDVHVQCGCPEHRATGAVCAHAVAVLLDSLSEASRNKKAPAIAAPPTSPGSFIPRAWEIRLYARFESEWSAGRLSVRLIPASAEPGPTDVRISAWLAARNASGKASTALVLNLAGPEVGEFLDLSAGHPRLEIDGRKGRFSLEEEPGPPVRLADTRLKGNRLLMELPAAHPRCAILPWGEFPAVAGPHSAARLPASSSDPGWLPEVAELLAQGRLILPVERFLANHDTWMDLFEPPQPGWLGRIRLAGAEPDFELELEGSLEAVDAVLKVRYPGLRALAIPETGEPIPGLPRLAPDGHLLARNPAAEESARRRMLACGFTAETQLSRFRLRSREGVLALIADDLPRLRQRWTVRLGERFATVSDSVHVVSPEIQESADHGSSLAFELSFQTGGGKRIPAVEIRRILRGGRRHVRLSDGAELVVSRQCGDLVNPLVEELGIGRPDERFELAGPSAILFRNLREILHNNRPINSSHDVTTFNFGPIETTGLNAVLRPYQAEGAAWMADRLKRLGGVLLADEMGLGKTIQTIASINHFNQLEREAEGVSLIVAPTSLLGNWMAELKRFTPGLKALLFHGPGRDRLRDQADKVQVIVTSYGTLVRDLAFHLGREYRLVAADEASLLRNPDADASKALFKLNARARVALTGTPVENRIQDLWSIFRFVAPGYLGSRTDFKERYEAAGAGVQASPGLLQRLRLRISPFVLRRTKDQVAKDLPDKIEIDEWLTLSDDQAELYSSLAKAGLEEIGRIRDKQGEGAGRMHLLTLLLRLRQVCVDPALLDLKEEKKSNAIKIERLLELLQERSENGLKTLVFSQFATNLRNLEKRIPGGSSRVFRIDGATRNRQELVDSFQASAGAAVFLISLKAGGYGLNLTAADAVIHLDPWWNPAVEAQATDRAHRIGQTRPVTVYRLLTRGTVEERVRRLQEQKRAIINAATGDSDSLPQNWTAEDMEGLLR